MFRPGDEVLVLPSGFTTTVAGIDQYGGPVDEAFPPMSVSIRLADDLDISRGDMLCRPHNTPHATQDVDAMVCWFSERPLHGRHGVRDQAHDPHARAPRCRTCTTAST